jgi:D-lactate dehydrogenase
MTTVGCRVAFFEVEEWERDFLSSSAVAAWSPHLHVEPLTPEEAEKAATCEVVSVFIYSRITDEVLAALPALKLIATRSTGADHIDLRAARARGIAVCNVPNYGENTVAEHAFALILGLSRKTHKAHERTQRLDFSLQGLEGFDLKGKTLGVVGAGAIGLHVIRIGRALDMRVLACDVRPNRLLAEVLGFQYVPLDLLLRESDVVSLHAPLTAETRHIINRETLAIMKRGALLINTARGELVDTAALIWALDEGILAGAGLDVVEGEEVVKEERQLLSRGASLEALRAAMQNYALARRDKVILTPHMAFYSREALQRVLEVTVANIHAFFEGHPQNLV